MEIAKTKECLNGGDGLYMDRSKEIVFGNVRLIPIGLVSSNDVKKTNLFGGGLDSDNRVKGK